MKGGDYISNSVKGKSVKIFNIVRMAVKARLLVN